MSSKYPGIDFNDPIIDSGLWFEILDRGEVNKQKLEESLKSSKFYRDENTENWVKLWHYFSLSDEDFDELVKIVQEEVKDKKFDELNVVKHLAGLFIRLSHIGLIKDTKKSLFDDFCLYVDHLNESGKIKPDPRKDRYMIDNDSWAGLGFAGKEIPEFEDFCKYLESKIEEARIDNVPEVASGLLETLSEDSQLFLLKLILNNSEHNIFYNTPILHHINQAEFVEKILSIDPEDFKNVGYMFSQRYSIRDFNSRLVEELQWLKSIRALLVERQQRSKGKLSSYRISELVSRYLDPAIEALSDE